MRVIHRFSAILNTCSLSLLNQRWPYSKESSERDHHKAWEVEWIMEHVHGGTRSPPMPQVVNVICVYCSMVEEERSRQWPSESITMEILLRELQTIYWTTSRKTRPTRFPTHCTHRFLKPMKDWFLKNIKKQLLALSKINSRVQNCKKIYLFFILF